jgi:hypothetical protein
MWFADKLGPAPAGSPQARANGPAKNAAPVKGAKNASTAQRAGMPQPSRPAPDPEKKKKGWF